MQLSSEPGVGKSWVQAEGDLADVPFMELTGLRHVTILANDPEDSELVRALVAEVQGDKEPLAGYQLCWC